MGKEPDWIEQDALEIIKELRGAHFVAMWAGYGDYELPDFIVSTLESFLLRAGVDVPAEDEDEEVT